MTQTILVLDRRFGLFPARFKVIPDGREIPVDAVERCWTENRKGRGRAKYHFRVRCGDNRYRLSEDGASGRWTISAIGEARGQSGAT